MLLKKSMMLGIIALAISASAFAKEVPPLVTLNNTSEFSTVLLDNGACAGSLGKMTRPGQRLEVAGKAVWGICGDLTGKGKCGATIIMSPNESDMYTCKGDKVKVAGHATLNLPDMTITKDSTGAGYSLDIKGNELTIS